MKKNKTVILHCSASTFGNGLLIDKWHKERGFRCNGYHFVILNGELEKDKYHRVYDGLIDSGREINEQGAHTYGHNENIGICLIGNSNAFTYSQMIALMGLLRLLKEEYGQLEIKQHSDYDEKKPFCAGFSDEIMKQIKEAL